MSEELKKLYDLNRGTKFTVPESEEVFTFDHIDGMYSYCTTPDGETFHPAAWTEVRVVL